jgi:hypothetical protein
VRLHHARQLRNTCGRCAKALFNLFEKCRLFRISNDEQDGVCACHIERRLRSISLPVTVTVASLAAKPLFSMMRRSCSNVIELPGRN